MARLQIVDDVYFPTVSELIFSTLRKDKQSRRGLSGTRVPQTASKPDLDEGVHFTDPDKSVASLGDSQGGYANFSSSWFRTVYR
jgi:hypothetical protein